MGTLDSTEDVEGDQQRSNKALHLTACSLRFGRKLPAPPRPRVSPNLGTLFFDNIMIPDIVLPI